MKRNIRIIARIIVNAICAPLFPTIFAVNDMICWRTWNYRMAARFELGCLWHNIQGRL